MRIAMVGTRGVPARYGGFETAIEEVGARLAHRGHDVVVFCRTHLIDNNDNSTTSYKGMTLVQLPALKKRALETLSHTGLSVIHPALAHTDAALLFNSANSPFLPVLRARGIPTATHVDGLEWQRTKWNTAGKTYYRNAEALAVRWSDLLIADAQGIADYYDREFRAPTVQIAYGAPKVSERRPQVLGRLDEQLRELGHDELGLAGNDYHLIVARFEPENHVSLIVEGYVASGAKRPLVVVGSAPYADEYTMTIRNAADDRVSLPGGVWDQELLDQLYANAFTYWHGHSVGGTNPSLLRALGAGAPTSAFDVVFNREVLGDSGCFFTTATDVAQLIESCESDPKGTAQRGVEARRKAERYDWDDVAVRYERLCERLTARDFPTPRPSGKRYG